MKRERRTLETLVSIIVVTVFLGQIYVSPFGGNFRLSMAVIALSFLLVFFRDVNALVCASVVGFLMFLFRAAIAHINGPEVETLTLVRMYMPVVTYYVAYGLLFEFLEIRNKSRDPVPFTLSLWVIDTVPNVLEVVVRREWSRSPFDSLLLAIILMGAVRSVVTYQLIAMADAYTNRVEMHQREKQLRELLLFTARLKTELFFLRKSRQDIEQAMKRSHEVYQRIQDPVLKPFILGLAKDIHEIKKDYNRVISGMETTLGKEGADMVMSIHEIFTLIKDNTAALSIAREKALQIETAVDSHLCTERCYPLISVLNNLVINAAEALEPGGTITLREVQDGGGHILSVRDTGPGIAAEDLESVFVPGYSTKFDQETGVMSTGIGLTHARQIVEEVFQSRLEVESEPGRWTEFRFRLNGLQEAAHE